MREFVEEILGAIKRVKRRKLQQQVLLSGTGIPTPDIEILNLLEEIIEEVNRET